MCEQVVNFTDYDSSGVEYDRVLWQVGLPGADDLTPLTLQLIPAELAYAFRISPESSKTMTDVNRASENTFSSLHRWHSQDMGSMNNSNFKPFSEERSNREETFTETNLIREGSDPRKLRRVESGGTTTEEADSSLFDENFAHDSSAKTVKRPRLVWTPQLHKRFIKVVAHLGIKNAVPKTIMQLMNVEGLTRENVASHLQKYRLFTKRMQPNEGPEGPSSSDHLFTSTPTPQSLRESGECGHLRNTNGHMGTPTLMPYQQQMMPMSMPMMGVPNGGHIGMPIGYGGGPSAGFHHQYNFGYYHPVASNDK